MSRRHIRRLKRINKRLIKQNERLTKNLKKYQDKQHKRIKKINKLQLKKHKKIYGISNKDIQKFLKNKNNKLLRVGFQGKRHQIEWKEDGDNYRRPHMGMTPGLYHMYLKKLKGYKYTDKDIKKYVENYINILNQTEMIYDTNFKVVDVSPINHMKYTDLYLKGNCIIPSWFYMVNNQHSVFNKSKKSKCAIFYLWLKLLDFEIQHNVERRTFKAPTFYQLQKQMEYITGKNIEYGIKLGHISEWRDYNCQYPIKMKVLSPTGKIIYSENLGKHPENCIQLFFCISDEHLLPINNDKLKNHINKQTRNRINIINIMKKEKCELILNNKNNKEYEVCEFNNAKHKESNVVSIITNKTSDQFIQDIYGKNKMNVSPLNFNGKEFISHTGKIYYIFQNYNETIVENICKKMLKKYPNDIKFQFTHQSLPSVVSKISEHYLNIPKSQIYKPILIQIKNDSCKSQWIKYISDDEFENMNKNELLQYDINGCYKQSLLEISKYKLPLYQYTDSIEPFDGLTPLKVGLYKVNPFYYNGVDCYGGWMLYKCVEKLLIRDIISIHDIKYQYISGCVLDSNSIISDMIKELDTILTNKQSKWVYVILIGLLGLTKNKTKQYFIQSSNKMRDIFFTEELNNVFFDTVEYTPLNNDTHLFTLSKEYLNELSHLPIWISVISQSIIKMYDLIDEVKQKHGNVDIFMVKCDAIIFKPKIKSKYIENKLYKNEKLKWLDEEQLNIRHNQMKYYESLQYEPLNVMKKDKPLQILNNWEQLKHKSFVLNASGGKGKSYNLIKLCSYYATILHNNNSNNKIVITSKNNEIVNDLFDKALKVFITKDKRLTDYCIIKTLNSLLRMDNDKIGNKSENQLKNVDYLFIDECYMIKDNIYYHLLKYTKKIKCIGLIGHDGQNKPIKSSMINMKKSLLINDLLGIWTYYTIIKSIKPRQPIQVQKVINEFVKNGEFRMKWGSWKQFKLHLKYDFDYNKYINYLHITFTNKKRKSINNRIHELRYGKDKSYHIGDPVITMDSMTSDKIRIGSKTRFFINDIDNNGNIYVLYKGNKVKLIKDKIELGYSITSYSVQGKETENGVVIHQIKQYRSIESVYVCLTRNKFDNIKDWSKHLKIVGFNDVIKSQKKYKSHTEYQDNSRGIESVPNYLLYLGKDKEGKEYIGQTSRTIEKRNKEHKVHLKHQRNIIKELYNCKTNRILYYETKLIQQLYYNKLGNISNLKQLPKYNKDNRTHNLNKKLIENINKSKNNKNKKINKIVKKLLNDYYVVKHKNTLYLRYEYTDTKIEATPQNVNKLKEIILNYIESEFNINIKSKYELKFPTQINKEYNQKRKRIKIKIGNSKILSFESNKGVNEVEKNFNIFLNKYNWLINQE